MAETSEKAKGLKDNEVGQSAVDPVVKCPHCGGDTGYQYKLHIYGIQYYGWDGDPENACFSDTGGKAFKETCCDCGKGI